jgi:hypothetical protein
MIYTNINEIQEYFNKDKSPLYCTSMYKNEVLFNFFIVNDIEAIKMLAHYIAYDNVSHAHEMVSGYNFMCKYPTVLKILPSYYDIDSPHIFDAAPFGQYIAGVDPRNMSSEPGYVNPNASFRTDEYNYRWTKYHGLYRLEANRTDHEWKPIYVLHIHSKYLSEISSLKDKPRGSHLLIYQ